MSAESFSSIDSPASLAEDNKSGLSRPRLLDSLWSNKTALRALAVFIMFTLISITAPIIAPHDPEEIVLQDRALPPFWSAGSNPKYLLGTDMLGRDVLTRLMYGGRVSLFVGLATVLLAGTVGMVLGLLAGFYRGFTDDAIMRIVEIQLSFPVMLLAITVMAVLGPSVTNLVLVLGAISWATYARIVRAETMSLREREFVEAALALGASPWNIIWNHIIPNMWAPVIVVATFSVGIAIISESALSFLGLGAEPTIPSWGRMLATGKEHLNRAPWLAYFPGIAFVIIVLAINTVGAWLRDYLDPKFDT